MAKMTCRCGQDLSNIEAPNDIQLRVYSDKEWEEIMDSEILIPWEIPLPKYDVWMCPKCKRIYVFGDGSDKPVMRFSLEKDKNE